MGASRRSAGRLSKVKMEPEGTGRFDGDREASMWVDVVNARENEIRGKAYSRKIPAEAGWHRQIVRFLEGYFLISSPSRYR